MALTGRYTMHRCCCCPSTEAGIAGGGTAVSLTTISVSSNTEGPAYISGVRQNISQVKSKRLCNQRWKLEFVGLAFKAGDSGFV